MRPVYQRLSQSPYLALHEQAYTDTSVLVKVQVSTAPHPLIYDYLRTQVSSVYDLLTLILSHPVYTKHKLTSHIV